MDKLRIWLAYYITPKDTRKYLIKALAHKIKKLEKEITELYDEVWTLSQIESGGNKK